MSRIIIACGGRDYGDRYFVYSALDKLHSAKRITLLIHGDAGKTDNKGNVLCGADKLAGEWAKIRGVPCWKFPANWKLHGKAAGPIRNCEMLMHALQECEAHELEVVAFPGGRGTADMKKQAEERGVKVVEAVGVI